MRVILFDDTKLVIHNGCNSIAQQRWATFVLGLGFLGIYFLVSKVVYNIIYLWTGILCHVFCFLLICWYFAPVITTFDKIKGTVVIERFNLFITKVSEHSISEIRDVQKKKIGTTNLFSKIYLLLRSGKYLYLSNCWENQKNCQEVLDIIKNFSRP